MPQVSAFGLVEGDQLRGLRRRGSGEMSEFAGGALTNFGSALHADAEMPRLGGKFPMKRCGGLLRRILLCFNEDLHELRANEVRRSGAKRRALDEIVESKSVFRRSKTKHKTTANRRRRKSAEVKACDNRKSAERTDEELVKIIAGDVFDHSAAAFAEATGAIDKFRANEEIAGSAIGMAKRRVHARGNDAADGGFVIKRDGKREKLFLFVQRRGEVVEIRPSIDADGEITRIVMGDLVEAGHVEGDVVA